ncbi:hypothetical protein [Brevundimonas sp. NIBR10]|uniref:hypothetical protein n=1 Tax=Brevundimonas sp. NIBR10 TaxID=3015997 RepID=UPI0022F175AB|nr:hypothetical protein [Brevundimonas sp. NIBR10]
MAVVFVCEIRMVPWMVDPSSWRFLPRLRVFCPATRCRVHLARRLRTCRLMQQARLAIFKEFKALAVIEHTVAGQEAPRGRKGLPGADVAMVEAIPCR